MLEEFERSSSFSEHEVPYSERTSCRAAEKEADGESNYSSEGGERSTSIL